MRNDIFFIFVMILFCFIQSMILAQPLIIKDKEQFALSIASEIVKRQADVSDKDNWTRRSKVTKAYPVYTEGIDAVSYYECKVTTENKDTGYVLINVDQTDFLVTEFATHGLCLNEKYKKIIGTTRFKVIRYDWFSSSALDMGNKFSSAIVKGRSLNIRSFNNFKSVFKENTNGKVTLPLFLYNQEHIKNTYKNSVNDFKQQVNKFISLNYEEHGTDNLYASLHLYRSDANQPKKGDQIDAAANTKIAEYAELKNYLPTGNHTHRSHQHDTSTGYSVGCGPVAWGIVYGYWRAFRGADNLFDGFDMDGENGAVTQKLVECINKCAHYCETEYTTFFGDKVGYTYIRKMHKGKKYAQEYGYTDSTCSRDRGTEASKFSKVIRSLNDDNPCIALVGADDNDVLNHYVVIEKAERWEKNGRLRWIIYYINSGNNGDSKWILVRDVWSTNHAYNVTACGSIFHPVISPVGTPHTPVYYNYDVEIKTGNIKWAGTDALVKIKLIGSLEESPLTPINGSRDDFERNTTTRGVVVARKDLGEIQKITLSHDDNGNYPGWFPEWVKITSQNTKKTWEFSCGRWLAKDELDAKTSVTFPQKKYHITVKTSDIKYAGTDANVYIILIGTSDRSLENMLKGQPGGFERNTIDTYPIFTDNDLGVINKIRVFHDNSGNGPGWHIEWINIKDPVTGREWKFDCNRWLSTNDDDGRIDVLFIK